MGGTPSKGVRHTVVGTGAPDAGSSLVALVLEGGEEGRRRGLSQLVAHARARAGEPPGPLPQDDLFLLVLRAQRSLLAGTRDRLHRALREVGGPLAPLLGRLLADARGPDLHVAIELARGLGVPELLPALRPLLASPDRWAAILSLQAVAASDPVAATGVLVECLAVEDLRWTAVALLADLNARASLPAVARCLTDPSPEVRLEAIRALVAFADKRILPIFTQVCARDPDPRVRASALTGLRRVSDLHRLPVDEAELRRVAQAQVQLSLRIDRILAEARLQGASDVHLVPGAPPAFRIHGELRDAAREPLSRADCESLLREIVPARFRASLEADLQADFPHVVDGVGRHRVNVFLERRGLAGVIRLVPPVAPSIEALGLPSRVRDITGLQNGLVLVTGRTGSGKSTTQAALVDLLNEARPVHIITLEDPIEYLHERKRGLVNQREVGRHSASFPMALRAALREDPDVMVVGEMRDLVTMRLAVEAAETGHLVIATLHTPTAVGAVQRLIEAFPVAEQQQVRLMLSDSLRMVVAQALVRRADGQGRVGVFELLVGTPAVCALVRENKLNQVMGMMQTGKAEGMRVFDLALMDLVTARVISAEEAFSRATNKDAFRPFLKGV